MTYIVKAMPLCVCVFLPGRPLCACLRMVCWRSPVCTSLAGLSGVCLEVQGDPDVSDLLKRAHWSAGGPLWLSPSLSHTLKLPQGPPYDHCTPHTHTADIFPQSSSIDFRFMSVAWHRYKTCRAHQSFSPKCMCTCKDRCICIQAHVFTATPWSAGLCIKAQKNSK